MTINRADRIIKASIDFDNAERITSDGLGDFADVASVSLAAGGFAGTASASIDSRLGDDGFFHTGNLAYNVDDASAGPPGHIAMSFSTDVEFSIDRPHTFAFRFDLTNEVGGISTEDIYIRIQGDDFFTSDFSASGVLEPGTYRFSAGDFVEKGTTLGGDRFYSVDYDIGLALSPVDGGGGGEPNPIPLPPAAWSGLAVLGAAGLARARRKLFN